MFDLIFASLDIFWIIVSGDFLEAFVLCPSDLIFWPLHWSHASVDHCKVARMRRQLGKIYIDRRDKPFFIVVVGWNKGFIYIEEDMVLTALRRSPRSKVQRSSAVLELPPLSGTPSLRVRTSNWSLSTRTCKARALVKHEMCIELSCTLCVIPHLGRQHECNDYSYADVT